MKPPADAPAPEPTDAPVTADVPVTADARVAADAAAAPDAAAARVPAPRAGAAPTGAVPTGAVPTEAAQAGAAGSELTERETRILEFERRWWKHAGAKEQAIRDAFDLSATRYYQLLNGLLDNPAALAHDPVLVGRLRRLRSTRARVRRR